MARPRSGPAGTPTCCQFQLCRLIGYMCTAAKTIRADRVGFTTTRSPTGTGLPAKNVQSSSVVTALGHWLRIVRMYDSRHGNGMKLRIEGRLVADADRDDVRGTWRDSEIRY